jgi:hypothetical protein
VATNNFQKHIADANEFSSVVLIRNVPDVLITTPFFDRVLTSRRVLMDKQDPRLFIWHPTIRASRSNSLQVFGHHSSLVRRILHKTPAPILPLLGQWLGCLPSLGLSRHFCAT